MRESTSIDLVVKLLYVLLTLPLLSMNSKKISLLFCLVMDIIGSISYILPVWGEWADLIWAPISALIFYRTFSGNVARIGSVINFFEELLPFVDIIPTFTIAFFYNKHLK